MWGRRRLAQAVINSMAYYERRLPHWHVDGARLFITWRLQGSFPTVGHPSVGQALGLSGSQSGRAFVAIGYSGLVPSAEEAKAIAEQKCREAGGTTCKAIGAWNYGCVYITVGSSTRGAGWAAGETVDDAMQRCRSMKYQCKPPIGGCVE